MKAPSIVPLTASPDAGATVKPEKAVLLPPPTRNLD